MKGTFWVAADELEQGQLVHPPSWEHFDTYDAVRHVDEKPNGYVEVVCERARFTIRANELVRGQL